MSSKGRILLAEDTPANIELYRTLLSRAGYDIDVIPDGLDAVDAAAATRYDVILMDLGLPRIDGMEATQRIKMGDGASAATPILALTADDDLKTRRACAAIGIVGFMVKPISPAELIKEVATTISGGAA